MTCVGCWAGCAAGAGGLHGMGGRLGSSALRDRDRAGLVSCCGCLAAAGSGSGLGCCGRCDRGAPAVLPVPVAAEPILLGLGFRLAGGLALSLAALDLLQHGAALRGGVPRAARRDDAAAASGITAPGRGLLRCAGLLFRCRAAGAAGALPVCMAAMAASISAREAPFSAMARATSSISLVMCGIIKVSERSSPRRLFGFC